MTNKKYLFYEIFCVAALIAFITVLCMMRSGGTEKDVEQVAAPVCKVMEQDQMVRKTNADAYKAFGFDLSKTEGIAYYANDNIMDVSEMLIIKLKDIDDAAEFKAAIESRVNDRRNLYKSYAPAQYSLLGNCIIETSGNTVFYCTAKNADKLYDAFKNAL